MLINYTFAATLAVGVTALGHNHHHHRHYARRVEVSAPRVTNSNIVYINSTTGERVPNEVAEECKRLGECVEIGQHTEVTTMTGTVSQQSPESQLSHTDPLKESLPTTVQTSSPTTSPSTPSSPEPPAAQSDANPAPIAGVSDTFKQISDDDISNDISNVSPKVVPEDIAPKDTHKDTPHQDTVNKTSDGISDQVPAVHKIGSPLLGLSCKQFPSPEQHRTVPIVDEGVPARPWTSLQKVSTKWNANMARIDVLGACTSCEPGCMCAYACQPGWAETQWPPTHGSRNESIGGLYCNSNNELEFTNPSTTDLCRKSAGDISVENRLKGTVATCRTVYPGDEAMVIPAMAHPGSKVQLYSPLNTDYTSPQGGNTSSHWYLNNVGEGKNCTWAMDETAPVILGSGLDAASKVAYLSIAHNEKATKKGLKLNFNIFIKGVVGGKQCMYVKGEVYEADTGGDPKVVKDCTSAIQENHSGAFVYTAINDFKAFKAEEAASR
ncbi:hypothetical protein CP533_2552 [Ophiocordyceps camponoti-saundersi (nom. inval.)]|nr:hypothetical protein CP533_2552 [Ophiocordyceps camponoti-saundersi (nom. inval.)]